MLKRFTLNEIEAASALLCEGGILGYPTEAVYGLGCNPHDATAFDALLALKQRPPDRGVLLIAADMGQIEHYIDWTAIPTPVRTQVEQSWPGPCTWILPCTSMVPEWIMGEHTGVALRITAHSPSAALCRAFGGALVSTSANLHGQPPARSVQAVIDCFGQSLDGVLDAPLGRQTRPSTIRDACSGVIIRA